MTEYEAKDKILDALLKNDKEFVKARLFIAVCDGENKTLKNVPHQLLPYGWAAYVKLLFADEDIEDVAAYSAAQKTACITATYSLMNAFCMTEDEMFESAWRNTEEILKLRVSTLPGMLMGFVDDIQCSPETNEIIVITNQLSLYGASALLYKGALQGMWRKIGGNFYILPSSVHEVLIVPCYLQDDVHMLQEMVSTINADEDVISPEDVLNNNVLFYDGDEDILKVATSLYVPAYKKKYSTKRMEGDL